MPFSSVSILLRNDSRSSSFSLIFFEAKLISIWSNFDITSRSGFNKFKPRNSLSSSALTFAKAIARFSAAFIALALGAAGSAGPAPRSSPPVVASTAIRACRISLALFAIASTALPTKSALNASLNDLLTVPAKSLAAPVTSILYWSNETDKSSSNTLPSPNFSDAWFATLVSMLIPANAPLIIISFAVMTTLTAIAKMSLSAPGSKRQPFTIELYVPTNNAIMKLE